MSVLQRILIVALIGFFNSAFAQTTVGNTTADTLRTVSSAGQSLGTAAQPTDSLNEYVDEIISFAKRFIGTPYRVAGASPGGFDCSGFIYYVMGNFGIKLSRSSPGIAEFGKTVKLSELQPGDLMFFKGSNVNASGVGHVAMVVEVVNGQIKFIHSSSSHGIRIDTFNASKYYVPRYIKSKRLDYGGIQPAKIK